MFLVARKTDFHTDVSKEAVLIHVLNRGSVSARETVMKKRKKGPAGKVPQRCAGRSSFNPHTS